MDLKSGALLPPLRPEPRSRGVSLNEITPPASTPPFFFTTPDAAVLQGPAGPLTSPTPGFAEAASPRQYRATFRSRWNEAEPPRCIVFVAFGSTAAGQKASALATNSEIIIDIVPLT